jgi:hypothetical protein
MISAATVFFLNVSMRSAKNLLNRYRINLSLWENRTQNHTSDAFQLTTQDDNAHNKDSSCQIPAVMATGWDTEPLDRFTTESTLQEGTCQRATHPWLLEEVVASGRQDPTSPEESADAATSYIAPYTPE